MQLALINQGPKNPERCVMTSASSSSSSRPTPDPHAQLQRWAQSQNSDALALTVARDMNCRPDQISDRIGHLLAANRGIWNRDDLASLENLKGVVEQLTSSPSTASSAVATASSSGGSSSTSSTSDTSFSPFQLNQLLTSVITTIRAHGTPAGAIADATTSSQTVTPNEAVQLRNIAGIAQDYLSFVDQLATTIESGGAVPSARVLGYDIAELSDRELAQIYKDLRERFLSPVPNQRDLARRMFDLIFQNTPPAYRELVLSKMQLPHQGAEESECLKGLALPSVALRAEGYRYEVDRYRTGEMIIKVLLSQVVDDPLIAKQSFRLMFGAENHIGYSHFSIVNSLHPATLNVPISEAEHNLFLRHLILSVPLNTDGMLLRHGRPYHINAILERLPVTGLYLDGGSAELIAAVADHPRATGLRTLCITGNWEGVPPPGADVIADSPNLINLTDLMLPARMSSAHADAIFTARARLNVNYDSLNR